MKSRIENKYCLSLIGTGSLPSNSEIQFVWEELRISKHWYEYGMVRRLVKVR